MPRIGYEYIAAYRIHPKLATQDIRRKTTKARHPQPNGKVERAYKTDLNESISYCHTLAVNLERQIAK